MYPRFITLLQSGLMAQRILLGELIHKLANKYQDKPCLTMAPSGETLSYRALD